MRVSYVGMISQDVSIKPGVIKVVLKSDAKALDEVVVTAMGISREKKALGYAVQDVKSDQLTQAANSNLAGALQGKVSGLDVKPSSGMPGASSQITIRGARSFSGDNTPLYVIDGFPSESSGLGSINPNDIESIDILKDASATAIYGARGANGVVIVTTKKGGAGKPTITYNGSVKVGLVKNTPEVMNAYDFVMLQQEIMGSGEEFQKNYITELYPTLDAYHNAKSYDWQDYLPYRSQP